MAKESARQTGLTIYLAKPGLDEPDATIKNVSGLRSFELTDEEGRLGTLYVEFRSSKPPKWGRFFEPQVKASDLGRTSSTAAVLHVTVDKRVFLLTFGQGRHLLKPNTCEERFGQRVTLNSISDTKIRSIDKHTLDTIGRHTRVQASKEAAPSEFGLDVEQDLLREITGTPDDLTLGKRLSGFDALHVIAEVELNSLRSMLARYLVQFKKDTYKKTFPWIDHIAHVTDAALVDRLDSKMLAAAAAHQSDKCWLAVPEPIEWAHVVGFRYGAGKRHATVHDLSFDSFVADNRIDAPGLSIDLLKRRTAYAVDGDDSPKYDWPVYKCVYCEVEEAGGTYLLNGGRWYKVESKFVDQVNESFRHIARYDVELPEYSDPSETAYNKRVAKNENETYTLMDADPIMVGGGYSRVEFCDLLRKGRDLIHVKRYGGSGLLSHLFAQGVVSGQLFVTDPEFRKALNGKLPHSHKLADYRLRPDAGKYRVVFAIISREGGKAITLPFFSRLNIKHAVQRLDGYGYKVALAKIRVSEHAAKTKKFKAGKARKH